MFLKKSCLLLIVFCINSLKCLPIETFQLQRITVPTRDQVELERGSFYQRELKRSAIKVGGAAAVLVALYVTYRAGEYFKKLDSQLETVDKRVANIELNEKAFFKNMALKNIDLEKNSLIEKGSVIEPAAALSSAKWIFNGIKSGASGTKNFAGDLGKSLIGSCPTFLTSIMLSTLWQQISSRVIQASMLETLSWYIEEHTQIWPLFHDISLASVSYDLQSELLSLQQVDNRARVCVRSYADDLAQLVKNHKEDCPDDGYFEHVSKGLKKEYEQKSIELSKLQNYAIPNIAKRKRAILQAESSLFLSDQVGRQNIAELVDFLTSEIQKMITFSAMHIDMHCSHLSKETIARGKKRVMQITDVTNRYLDHMELLLNMDSRELESMSITNKGVFTCTYEFERLFREQVGILHRYCLCIK